MKIIGRFCRLVATAFAEGPSLMLLARAIPAILLAVTTSTVTSSAVADGRNAGSPPPNVLMIVSDDQAFGDYSFMGHPVIRTPPTSTSSHPKVPSSAPATPRQPSAGRLSCP